MNKNFIPFTEKDDELIGKIDEKVVEKIIDRRVRAIKKFPLATAILALFGLHATFYGFEKMMDDVDLFHQDPWIILLAGIIILIVSGTIYKNFD